MKILLLHDFYQQAGGEDTVVEQEKNLLESNNNQVRLLTRNNDSIVTSWNRANAALTAIYSPHSKAIVAAEINSFRPDIVHVHNFFPLFSPSVYYACRQAGVPVVQTLHNFRLVCPSALLFRNGKPCELCLDKAVPWPGVLHACYRENRVASAVIASMIGVHHFCGTWHSAVNAYITMTQFSREKLIAGGLPPDRLFLKPNFVFPDPGKRSAENTGYALFVGRLSPEKGIRTLLSAWDGLAVRRNLKIIGTGPLEGVVRPACTSSSGIEFLGPQPPASVINFMKAANFLVFPSECYEGFPRVIVEAFAKGLPVLASQLGSMAELLGDQHTGRLFRPGDAQDLAEKIEWMFTHPVQVEQMSEAARQEFEAKYTAERNYEMLMKIYQHASHNARTRPRSGRGRAGQELGTATLSEIPEKIGDQVPI